MFKWLKKLSAPRKRPRERTWLRFALLDRLHLTRRELALIVIGLRARPGFELKDFDT